MSCIYWDKPEAVSTGQEDNAIEAIAGAILRSYTKGAYSAQEWLETCGPSSLEACLKGLGIRQDTGKLQPSDYYACLANDPQILKRPNWTLPKHRYLEAYPLIVNWLYPELNCRVDWLPASRDKIIELVRGVLSQPQTVAIINTADPGHYIAALNIDNQGIVYYNDSWLQNYWNRAATHYRSVHINRLALNMRAGIVTISALIPTKKRPDGPEML
jgi:hypothetical protein